MSNITDKSFLIQRSVIALKVQLLSNGNVSVNPYQCDDKNLRLWRIIARTQATYAEAALHASRNGSSYAVLLAAFNKQGWNIIHESEL